MKIDIRFGLAALVLCTCIAFVWKDTLETPDDTDTSYVEFPSRMLDWIGDEVVYDQNIVRALSPDKIVYMSYHKDAGPPITLFIACYDTLEKSDLSHSPIVCFTGQGWEIKKTSEEEIPVRLPDISSIEVNEIIQKKVDMTMIVLFWYQSAHHTFANRGIQKIRLFFDKLLGEPDNNGFVRVTATVPAGWSLEETTAHVYGFVCDLYPEIRRLFL